MFAQARELRPMVGGGCDAHTAAAALVEPFHRLWLVLNSCFVSPTSAMLKLGYGCLGGKLDPRYPGLM